MNNMKRVESYKYLLLISFIMCATTGCIQGGINGMSPGLDVPIKSVEYYKIKYDVDLKKMNHDMDKEVQIIIRANEAANNLGSHIVIGGQPVHVKPQYQHLLRSKRLGTNDYFIGLDNYPAIEKQLDDYACWASCIQYLTMYAYNKRLDQKEIIDLVRKSKIENDPGASVVDIMSALGLFSTRLSPSGSNQIIELLGRGHPVIIGSRNKQNQSGHAEIIVGARYSFVNPYLPSLPPQETVAFTEFTVLDPWDGKSHLRPASEYDNTINFVLSFNVKE